MHGHRDMEIVTYVLEGELAHRDSLGNGATLRPGEFQRMSAGTGIQHSEFNPSPTDAVHLYQIWILPERKGLTPSYEQKAFPAGERRGQFRRVASQSGRDGSLRIQQDVEIFLSLIERGEQVTHQLPPGRYAWLQVLRGAVTVNEQTLEGGDGAAIRDENALVVESSASSEVMLFDLP
jgi:redox-sensitive bicupin YhaK (pirin superfamily)